MPGHEDIPARPDGYVISFAPFHERGLAAPPHYFLRGLLHYYRIELQHLNPNGIQQISAFVALCEGYLGCEPHFELWKYFFAVTPRKDKERDGRSSPAPMGCAGIHFRPYRRTSTWPSR